ncbi:hypothetical protein C2G38_2250922 [Gigaspora rosea]|uniref:PAS domain-containing protein n=1 Tax=Gigaspora rosea TaxID=44941 RepID=A0A397UL21_9GLOM|nr:hypothetical protein C2G38_2250922 [Gigaspora rosea]
MSLPLINGGDDIENEESKFINMVYNYDWSSTSLGPIDTWDPVLKHVTNLILNSKFPFAILINPPDWILLYNKAYVSILKAKHPDALGKRLQDFLPEYFENHAKYKLNKHYQTLEDGEFGHYISKVKSLESASHIITKVLSNNKDILYTLIYLIKHTLNTSSESLIAHLIATTFDDDEKGRNIPDYLPEIHEIIDLNKDSNKNYDAYIELKRGAFTFVLKM